MKIVATDLDRTLFSNGKQKIRKGAIREFEELVRINNITLVYVTGRYLKLLKEGIKEYLAPKAKYYVCDVGTSIYTENFERDSDWDSLQGEVWNNHDSGYVAEVLKDFDFLKEQEEIKQNKFKQSYYLKDDSSLDLVKKRLAEKGLLCEVIYSYDTEEETGLLDIQPKGINKEGALEYVRKKLGALKKDVIYSGDSGNDYHPLTAGYKGVLVGNAHEDLKKQLEGKVYIAKNYYVLGIIEGMKHYEFI